VKTRIEFSSGGKAHRDDVGAASPVKNLVNSSSSPVKFALSPSRALGYHNEDSSLYHQSTPPRLSALTDSPSKSPIKLTEKHGKTLHQYNRLAKKMEPLTATIRKSSKVNISSLLLSAAASVLSYSSWRSTVRKEAFEDSPASLKRRDCHLSLLKGKKRGTPRPVPGLTPEKTTDFPSHCAPLVFLYWSVQPHL